MATLAELEAELARRGETVSSESVMDEKVGSLDEFKKFAESALKGVPKGLISIAGGWGNLYDYVKKSKDPSLLSTAGLANVLKNVTGVDVLKIPGYRGAYEFTEAAAPAAAASAMGVPGLFSRTPAGVLGESTVAGTTALAAQSLAPESPLAQLAMQAAPYAAKGAYKGVQSRMTTPEGMFPPLAEAQNLARVGPLTPGEMSLSRPQLAAEARVEASPKSGAIPTTFRNMQAVNTESFLDNLFKRSTSSAMAPQAATDYLVNSFNNYGKTLSSKLRSDAAKDFGAAKSSGGMIDTAPIVKAAESALLKLPPEISALDSVKNAVKRITDEYVTPATAEAITPSTILGPTGKPATVTVTPAQQAQNLKIDVKRLQENLSTWGKAAYSGTADFGKGNIFEGVAPGVAKGISLSILNGFRSALDDAITAGVPGADKLVKARDNFKTNLAQIEQFADRPLTRAFDVTNTTDLVPEIVMAKLKTMPPSQRQFLIEVMQKSPTPQVNEILDTIRRAKFDEVMSAGKAVGQAADSPKFRADAALKALDKKGDLADLFPNKTDLDDAKLAVNYMRRVLSSEAPSGTVGPGAGAVYGAAKGAGAGTAESIVLREIYLTFRDLVANPEAFAKVMFNPEYKKAMLDLAKGKSKGQKALDALSTIGKASVVIGGRGGAMLDVTRPEEPMLPPVEVTDQRDTSLQDLEEEARSRGLVMEQ